MRKNIALCLICKPSDEEAEVLKRCLINTAPFVDKIFITITGQNKKCEEVCKLFKAEVSHFDWCYDFAKARNFNFSQVPKEYEYILWCDADDVIRGLENLKETIKKHPADVYTMFYYYDFDEEKNPTIVHHKTRVIKNDNCVEWVGQLHEDFKENRELRRYHIKGIEVLHLSNEKRFENAKKRNLEIAEKNISKDPRSFWNLGNALKALGENERAVIVFQKFLEKSSSDGEKYIARLRLSEIYWQLDKKGQALDEVRLAIGTKPDYPDAYHLAGSLYYETKQYEKARDSYLSGLAKKPPYYSIIVYNPRDYDYTPMMNLAKTFFSLSRPDMALILLKQCLIIYPKDEKLKKTIREMEKETDEFNKIIPILKKLQEIKDKKVLKKEFDKIPDEFKSYPAICNIRNVHFVKEKSSGKDLVFYCGSTAREWDGNTTDIGGSEEAVINLARLFAKNFNVSVYNNCGHKEKKIDGVSYKPFWSWNYRDKQDIVIIWRTPMPCDYEINCDKIFIDLHDVIPEKEFTEKRLNKIKKIFVKSKFHRSVFPNIPDNKFAIIPNGINSGEFEKDLERDNLIINTSSPDRGLRKLVDMFPEIKKRVPNVKLKWAYGWGVWDVVHGNDVKKMEWKAKLQADMKRLGIEELGMIGKEEVNKLYLTANVFAYPSEFAEIDNISLTKALASGAIPVTTDFAAMGEKQYGGFFIHSEKTKDNWCKNYQFDFSAEIDDKIFVDKIVEVLKGNFQTQRKFVRDKYNWDLISNKYKNEVSN